MLQICVRTERVWRKLPSIQGIRANLVYIVSLQKCNNIQYDTLGRWVDGTIVSSSKCLMFQVYFFHHLFQYFHNFTKLETKVLCALTPSQQSTVLFQSIKIILGPSDEAAYYFEDCRISKFDV